MNRQVTFAEIERWSDALRTGRTAEGMPRVELPSFPDRCFSIVDFGAVPGGAVKNTEAINRAIAACSEAGGGTVIIPEGLWLTGPIRLQNNVNLRAEAGALVLFSREIDDYPLVRTNWEGLDMVRRLAPISGRGLENVAITGPGVFDGSGHVWRSVLRSKVTENQWNELVRSGGYVENDRRWWPSEAAYHGPRIVKELDAQGAPLEAYAAAREFLRPVLVSLIECRRVLLDGPTFQNSPAWNLHPLLCEDLTIRNVTVRNPWYSQNGDGLDIDSCRRVHVYDCRFDVGDDAICMKSGKDEAGRRRGRPTEDVFITNCIVYAGHGGFVIGSEMSGGVRNVCVTRCTFIGTDCGLRFKSTRGRGGVVENIYISRVDMIDIPTEPIRFEMYYQGGERAVLDAERKVLPVTEETPIFRNIYVKDVTCRGAGRAAVLQGLPEMPIRNISLENLRIWADEGLICVDGEGIELKNVEIHAASGPAMTFRHSRGVTVAGCRATEGTGVFVRVEGEESAGVRLSGCDLSQAAKGVELGAGAPEGAVEVV